MADILIIIAPVFLVLLLGYALGKTNLFPEGASDVLITFVWYIAIPSLMFREIASRDLPQAHELLLVVSYYIPVVLLYLCAVLIARFVFKLSAAEQGIFALSACFSNGGFIGIPLLDGAFGKEGVRLLLVILSFQSILLLTTTTVLIESTDKDASVFAVIRKTFSRIFHNPLLIALMSSLMWAGLGIPFPHWLDRVLALPAQSASPVGLFAAGMALSSVAIAGDLRHASISVFWKTIAIPAAVFIITHFVAELQPLWVAVATLTAALPTGMVAYSFSAQYGGIGSRRAASTVLISTAISFFSLSFLLYVLT